MEGLIIILFGGLFGFIIGSIFGIIIKKCFKSLIFGAILAICSFLGFVIVGLMLAYFDALGILGSEIPKILEVIIVIVFVGGIPCASFGAGLAFASSIKMLINLNNQNPNIRQPIFVNDRK
jgi:hypothetical protein